ncbi:MAG: hypothetical protein AB2A00_18595, partial [Myxococcota bacterium]
MCLQSVDVSIYVTGQKARCSKCGNRFIVERSGNGAAPSLPKAPVAAASPEAERRPTKPERPSLSGRAKAAPAQPPPTP